jgi:hypothetical protein
MGGIASKKRHGWDLFTKIGRMGGKARKNPAAAR